jgi:2,3,4,5-tetrahydropyridine-2-carboxylate N-succinyltransferase
VSPSGVRILNPNNVRLGAHLAEGTVVMTAGAVNYNAGTLGEAMIEGRVSAGITVGARSDVGGGASLLGTLSGGNEVVVTVGEDCLLEAQSGLGIPVGDRVRVEVGFYVKSTTPLVVADSTEWTSDSVAKPYLGQTVKAIALAGISDAVFRRNAHTGTPEVVPRGDRVWGKLNAALHKN